MLDIYKPTLNQFGFNNQFITKLSLIRDKFIIFRCFLSMFMIYDVQKSMIHVNTLKIRGWDKTQLNSKKGIQYILDSFFALDLKKLIILLIISKQKEH